MSTRILRCVSSISGLTRLSDAAILLSIVEPAFIMARMTFVREASSKMYSPVVFAISQLAAETPASILCAVVFFLLLYYPAGFNMETNRAGYAFAMILITEVRPFCSGRGSKALFADTALFVSVRCSPSRLAVSASRFAQLSSVPMLTPYPCFCRGCRFARAVDLLGRND